MFKTIFNFVLHAMAMEWGTTKIIKATQQIKIIIKKKILLSDKHQHVYL